jgi:hypothetical protein
VSESLLAFKENRDALDARMSAFLDSNGDPLVAPLVDSNELIYFNSARDGDDDLPASTSWLSMVYANPDQQDFDDDSIGDLCEEDFDRDGIWTSGIRDGSDQPDPFDNCPLAFNPNQTDANLNSRGDVCDVQENYVKLKNKSNGLCLSTGLDDGQDFVACSDIKARHYMLLQCGSDPIDICGGIDSGNSYYRFWSNATRDTNQACNIAYSARKEVNNAILYNRGTNADGCQREEDGSGGEKSRWRMSSWLTQGTFSATGAEFPFTIKDLKGLNNIASQGRCIYNDNGRARANTNCGGNNPTNDNYKWSLLVGETESPWDGNWF